MITLYGSRLFHNIIKVFQLCSPAARVQIAHGYLIFWGASLSFIARTVKLEEEKSESGVDVKWVRRSRHDRFVLVWRMCCGEAEEERERERRGKNYHLQSIGERHVGRFGMFVRCATPPRLSSARQWAQLFNAQPRPNQIFNLNIIYSSHKNRTTWWFMSTIRSKCFLLDWPKRTEFIFYDFIGCKLAKRRTESRDDVRTFHYLSQPSSDLWTRRCGRYCEIEMLRLTWFERLSERKASVWSSFGCITRASELRISFDLILNRWKTKTSKK